MYSIIISLIVGAVIGAITQRDLGTGWGIFCAVGVMLISQIVIGLLIRRKVGKLNLQLQQIMQAAQAKINRQMQQYQMRPPGNMRLAQQNLEKLQSDAVRRTLEATKEFEPWYKWNMMLKKQINTMKMQLHFQLKEFGKVDCCRNASCSIRVRSRSSWCGSTKTTTLPSTNFTTGNAKSSRARMPRWSH